MIVILGPTASGKTQLAARLANEIGAEIISADSRQVYRGMDIGTGKDLQDYTVNGRRVRHHLIDIRDAGEKYNVFEYQRDFLQAYNDIVGRGQRVVLCGGTGLYIEAVLKGYRLMPVPENKELRERLSDKSLAELTEMLRTLKERNHSTMHNTTDVDTSKRAIRAIEIEEYYLTMPVEEREFPAIPSVLFGVSIARDLRRQRISSRLRTRLAEGMVDEVRGLMSRGVKPDDLIYYGLEYKYLTEYVLGRTSYDEMFVKLETAIHQFAKRQMTWFRGMERRGFTIHWLDTTWPMERKLDYIKRYGAEQ